MQLGARQYSNRTKPFPHRWAVMFLIAVGFWNFLGAGVFGFLINPADRVLLRDWYGTDGKPRTRIHDGRVRYARNRVRGVWSALT